LGKSFGFYTKHKARSFERQTLELLAKNQCLILHKLRDMTDFMPVVIQFQPTDLSRGEAARSDKCGSH